MEPMTCGASRVLEFTKVEDNQQILALAETIKQDFPYSVTMYNVLLSLARGYFRKHAFYFLPYFRESHVILWLWNDDPYRITIFCREEEIPLVMEALEAMETIDWRGCVSLFGPHYLEEPLREVARRKGTVLRSEYQHTFVYEPRENNQPLRCHAGFKVCRLGRGGIRRLLEMSKYAKSDPVDDYFRLGEDLPCVGVYLDPTATRDTLLNLDNVHTPGETVLPKAGAEDLPVSWISSSFYGALGMLGTLDPYRRRGLAALVATVAARIQNQQGFAPHVYVEADNTVSFEVFRKMAGWVNTPPCIAMFSDAVRPE